MVRGFHTLKDLTEEKEISFKRRDVNGQQHSSCGIHDVCIRIRQGPDDTTISHFNFGPRSKAKQSNSLLT